MLLLELWHLLHQFSILIYYFTFQFWRYYHPRFQGQFSWLLTPSRYTSLLILALTLTKSCKFFTVTIQSESENCYKVIKGAWQEIEDTAAKPGGLEILRKSFRICKKYAKEKERFLIVMRRTICWDMSQELYHWKCSSRMARYNLCLCGNDWLSNSN